ncbi:MAG: zf-TFIIB domain-containing protein [Verrucomicrobiota bacterium]
MRLQRFNEDEVHAPTPLNNSQPMKCPACKNPLREKSAGDMTLDVCYGGCGGIWFDAAELERVSARAATTLHSIWQVPVNSVKLTEPRLCPRCPEQVLERKWFSELKQVEIDQCAKCGGIWLDAGEFSRIYQEIKGAKVTSPIWATAIAEAAALVEGRFGGSTKPVPGNSPDA